MLISDFCEVVHKTCFNVILGYFSIFLLYFSTNSIIVIISASIYILTRQKKNIIVNNDEIFGLPLCSQSHHQSKKHV